VIFQFQFPIFQFYILCDKKKGEIGKSKNILFLTNLLHIETVLPGSAQTEAGDAPLFVGAGLSYLRLGLCHLSHDVHLSDKFIT
jgi:hypothetical protein